MKKVHIFVLMLALVMSLSLVACGGEEEEATAVPAAEVEEEAVVEEEAPVEEAAVEEEAVACCMAMTAECLACAEGVEIAEYCADNPETVGCEEMAEEEMDEQEPVVLTMVTHETEVLDADFWLESIDAVLEDLPDYISVEWSSTSDRDNYARTLAATDQFPDIPYAVTVSDFAEAGLLVPFDQDYLDEYFVLPDASKIDGEAWSPPVGAQLFSLVFYNKAIFEEVGIEEPTTWDEFMAISQALLDAGYTPQQMCGAETWCASFPGVGLVSQNVFGDDPEWMLKRKAGEVSFSDPEFVGAMQMLADQVEAGYIDGAAALGTDFGTANQAFYDGGVPMYMQGSWFFGYPPEDMGFEMGAFFLPRPDGMEVASIYVGGGTRVSAVSEHPEELMLFAEAFEKHPDVMHAVVQSDALFPMMKNMTIEDYNVELSDIWYDTYENVVMNDDYLKVSAFTWANNDLDPIPGWKDEFYITIQNILLGEDVAEEMARLDQVWDETAERLGQ